MSTKVTTKYQATVPRDIRKVLELKPGEELEWHVVRGLVVVDTFKKIADPVRFLTTQTKLDIDAVKLIKRVREDFG